tara:strand:+ start:321 stop:1013 length:693 start_codon:yes stop_codon:yes gene_type:complete
MRAFLPLLFLFMLHSFALGQEAGLGGEAVVSEPEGRSPQVLAGNTAVTAEKLEAMRDKMHQLEVDLARLGSLQVEVDAVKRELTDALMDISNVLAVADRNLDAANTTLGAAEAAIDASQSYLSMSATIITILALLASLGTWYFSQNIIGRTAEGLVKKLKSNGTNGENSIIEEIKATVHAQLYQDAVDNISFVMQDDEFRKKLGELIDRAVQEKCGGPDDGGPLQFDNQK